MGNPQTHFDQIYLRTLEISFMFGDKSLIFDSSKHNKIE